MANLEGLSIVIPIYNMGDFVSQSYETLVSSGVRDLAKEILYVDDGSIDQTSQVIEQLTMRDDKVRLLSLGKNSGRFIARRAGAEGAKFATLLFIDARVSLPAEFGRNLKKSLAMSQFVQPQVQIDVERNVFCLYWQRSHERLFREHYRAMAEGPLDLNFENYDRYLKGTTALVAPRDLFLRACLSFGEQNLLSDDTALMKEMVKEIPLRLDPSVWIEWVPRETLSEFLWRLYDRGPGLVEYHVFTHRGWIFASIITGLVGLGVWLAALVVSPSLGLLCFTVAVLAGLLSVAAFGKNTKENFQMAPLHLLVLFAVGFGILKGLLVNGRRWMKGELKNVSTNTVVKTPSH